MALTPDQNAILQLLLERGQSYSDLARVLGVDETEVRARARAALEELGGADPDREVGLTDYLLGQADPIGRADAVRHLRDDPVDHRLASELAETLRAMYADAELPRLPGESRQPRRPRSAASGGSGGRERPGISLSSSQTRLIVGLGAAAVLLVAVVLALTGAFGGDDDEPTQVADGSEPTAPTDLTDEGDQLERVVLRAKGGGNARGEAVFGIATADQPYVDIAIEGLDPAPKDKTYVIWLMLNEAEGYPLSPIAVNPQGRFGDRFSIPSAVLQIVARVQKVDVSIAPVKEIQDVVREAIDNTALVLEKPGQTVLEGAVPTRGGGGAGAEQEG